MNDKLLQKISRQQTEIIDRLEKIEEYIEIKDIPDFLIEIIDTLEKHIPQCKNFKGITSYQEKNSEYCTVYIKCSCGDVMFNWNLCGIYVEGINKRFLENNTKRLNDCYLKAKREEREAEREFPDPINNIEID